MNGGEAMVLMIVLVAIFGRVIMHYMNLQQRKPQQDPEHSPRIDALERRVQTLESIVTDRGYDLKREFDKL